MEVTETLSDGLKREFQVQVPAADLEARVSRAARRAQGPRPVARLPPGQGAGRAPQEDLRQGRDGRDHRGGDPRAQRQDRQRSRPQARHGAQGHDPERRDRGREGHRRASPISPIRSRSRCCRRSSSPISRASSSNVWSPRSPTRRSTKRSSKIAEQNRPFAAKGEGAKVEKGDRVVIDFTGTLDGAPFEGGTGGDVGVNVGSGTFIPGFEDQLIGMGAGETRLVKVTFPGNYVNAQLAGKDGRVRRHGEIDRGAGHGHDRRCLREVARPRIARQAQGGGQRPAAAGACRAQPPARQAPAP